MSIKLAIILLLAAYGTGLGQSTPSIAEVDRVRLAEAFRLGDQIGDQVWHDWHKAPFAVLLVTPDYEFLVRHPNPSPDFTLSGYDSLLKSKVYYRKRTQSVGFLATFPAVSGVSTIVVGQAENTQAKTSTPWVVTLLHEHFHQLQDSQPNAFAQIAALNLARGDQTGMWMLNFPFPYESSELKEQFTLLTRALATAIQSPGKRDFEKALHEYLEVRRKLKGMLGPDDYKYMSFQLWKEGVARYTEYKVANAAARSFKPGRQFRELKDFAPFDAVAKSLLAAILKELTTLKIEEYKRVAFYPIGAGEALLLDRVDPNWHRRYLKEKFDLEKYFPAMNR